MRSLKICLCHRLFPLLAGGEKVFGFKTSTGSCSSQSTGATTFNIDRSTTSTFQLTECHGTVQLERHRLLSARRGQRSGLSLGHRSEHYRNALHRQYQLPMQLRFNFANDPLLDPVNNRDLVQTWLAPAGTARPVLYWQAYLLDQYRDSARDLHHLPGLSRCRSR